jgi:ABC-type sugar transport system ATPase subunit
MVTVTLENVEKRFGALEVVPSLNLAVASGELCVLVGPSGSGKSTLLRIIAGLEEASAGTIRIDGEIVNALEPVRRGTAMVFQSYALYPHMTVYKNIAFGLQIAGTPKAERDRKVREVAEMLQLTPLLERLPKELSGGQRQRVAIGRALVRKPKVFLFDEPLSNLDAALRTQMRAEIARLHGRLDTTMIYVTHDQVEAMTLADRIVVLNHGRIEQIGTPLELYHEPANTFVAGFIGSPQMNLLKIGASSASSGKADDEMATRADLRLRGALRQATEAPIAQGGLTLGIRPEHFQIGTGGAFECDGIVELVEHFGDETVLNIKLADGNDLLVRTDGEAAIIRGARLTFTAREDRCHLFDGKGARLTFPTGTVEAVSHAAT